MNKEIKEILNYLKKKDNTRRIKCITTEEAQQLLDYIANLEQENKEQLDENYKLSEWLVKKQKRIEELEKENKHLNDLLDNSNNECEKLRNKQDKAIGYIKANRNVDDYDKFVIEDDKNILLGILNGSDE
jgi:thiamine kinase-like enzyme